MISPAIDQTDGRSAIASAGSLRSLLFVPAHDRSRLEQALESGADAVVADLEDLVPAGEKPAARSIVATVFGNAGRPGPLLMVRLNGPGTDDFPSDVETLRELDLDAIVLPKAAPDAVAALGPHGPPIIAVVESAQGVRLAFETASAERVQAVVIGGGDLGRELRLEPRADGQALLYVRSKLVVDSAAAGIRAPFDVARAPGDPDGFEHEAQLARSVGLGGKCCVDPEHVSIVNRVFEKGA
jgi:citrate lyase beta subunit